VRSGERDVGAKLPFAGKGNSTKGRKDHKELTEARLRSSNTTPMQAPTERTPSRGSPGMAIRSWQR
jgi:hypothetical protein